MLAVRHITRSLGDLDALPTVLGGDPLSPAVLVLCYAVVAISCAQTILLIDGEGPASSLARSWRLTTGSFWRLSLIYTVALIILIALYAVIGAMAGFLAAVFAHGDLAMVTAFTP